MVVLRIVAFAAGVALVAWVIDAAVRTFMLPRASRIRLTRWIGRTIAKAMNTVAPPSRSYAWRDRVHALRPPLTLLVFQATWLLLVFLGFALMFWAVNDDVTALQASRDSASSLFTLGFADPGGTAPLILVCAEAIIGLTLLALLISYLPTIYAAFQRREFMVAKLAIRAGSPTSPWRALAVAYETESFDQIDNTMWSEWEDWFIDIGESHGTLIVLSFYRSPDPQNHWIATARTVLDLAALRVAVVATPATVGPHITIRSGSLVLRTLTRFFRFPGAAEPQRGDPISITRPQFDAACRYLATHRVPLKDDRDQAWADFAALRVNYDATIEAAAKAFNAPPDPWDSITNGA